ncbi:MAG: hypothetical protein LWW85_11130 [Marinilabiliales bacterium]|nr:hypothetical protein [Marinilabiliales bacterium]
MKKSTFIRLVLVAAVASSCGQEGIKKEKRVFMRADTTANYTPVHGGFHGGYFPFIPYGIYRNNRYSRAGYFSNSISEHSNIGSNAMKGSITRGGFGSSALHVSS